MLYLMKTNLKFSLVSRLRLPFLDILYSVTALLIYENYMSLIFNTATELKFS